MPWNGQGGGGGPWGGGNNQGPWGNRGKSGGPKGGGSQEPPNLEELLRQGQEKLKNLLPVGGGGFAIGGGIAALVVVLWLASGIYRVQPDEQGVVLRFGDFAATTLPGLHYHWPTPIETVELVKVTRVNRTAVGMNTDAPGGIAGARQQVPEEALMLTGDENIVDINLSVFWSVKDARAYKFNIRDADSIVKSSAESAIREIVGRTPINSVLAQERRQIETDTEKLLQLILDSYGAGIQVNSAQLQKADPPQQVIDAFRDVQRAVADSETARNEAEAYRNDIVPRARGEAERIIQEAAAYHQEITARAQGDAARFQSVLAAYREAKDVTAERLYLETMEQVLKNARKILMDKSGPGVLPYLPLPELRKPGVKPDASAPSPSAGPSASSQSAISGNAVRGTDR